MVDLEGLRTKNHLYTAFKITAPTAIWSGLPEDADGVPSSCPLAKYADAAGADAAGGATHADSGAAGTTHAGATAAGTTHAGGGAADAEANHAGEAAAGATHAGVGVAAATHADSGA